MEKTVYLPKPEGDSMRFFRAASPDGPWTVGAFGIREPADCTERTVFRPEDGPALVVTPGLAFDRRGNRMGRGRGYYDRFFAGLDAAGAEYYTVGFCLAEQLVDEVPVDRRDKRLDALCTPEGVLCFR
ncbi:hypothetical protein AGMMS50267_16270 [Spirochaetia bacterium]|nr:hypothetical protein AGMMS50267_16270 [Spirochaetia bacterium]